MNPTRALLSRRLFAKVIDLFIVFALGMLLPRFIGPLLGFAYSLLADALPTGKGDRRSIGKRAVNLAVIHRKENRPLSLADSVVRNSPIGIATFFAIIPIVGWMILFLVGIPLMAMEVYLILTKNGLRLGDVMADTEVRWMKRGKPPHEQRPESPLSR